MNTIVFKEFRRERKALQNLTRSVLLSWGLGVHIFTVQHMLISTAGYNLFTTETV